ncbi:MAG: PAN domain-containing protein [Alphaproteobacteria bacterium]|nr:PAN domain-containing protein [Alphaproteobacteria bacterium]
MAALRLWYLACIAALLALIAVVPAHGDNDSEGMNARDAEMLADFLILAVKPEGDERDYKLVEIGDTKINAGLLGVAVNTLPLDFLGLGPADRDYNEAAEIAQCRAACRANSECRDVAYVRPTSSRPVGVCHLKRVASFGVMSPVVEGHERPAHEPTQPSKTDGRLVVDGGEKTGRITLSADDVRATPLTLKFPKPAASVTVFIRAANFSEGRAFAAVEAFAANGKRVAQNGAWIQAGKYNFNRGVTIATDADSISTVKIVSRDGPILIIDGIEFARTLITPIPVPETKPETKPEPPREIVPPAPRLPPPVAIFFPLPPRPTPTAPPLDITPSPAASEPPLVAEAPPPTQPAPEAPPIVAATPPARNAATPPPARKRGLPLWLALGAIALMLTGAGVYTRNHRARIRQRLTTRLVSDGLANRTITIDLADDANHSLRFVVRTPANVNAPATHIEFIPKGATA